MLLSIVLLASGTVRIAPIFEFKDAVAITRVSQGGRAPAFRDSVVDEIVRTGNIQIDDKWKPIQADKDGWLEAPGGYFFATYDSPTDRPAILDANGQSVVYVDGEPRAGDPYGYGNMRLPIHLKAGKNTFLFGAGRGHVKASIAECRAEAQIEVADSTLPDVVEGESAPIFGAVVVLNCSGSPEKDLSIRSETGGRVIVTRVPEIQPYSLRKVRFDFATSQTDRTVKLTLLKAARTLDAASVETRLRKPSEQYKRTFVSDIDGSVQYYAVCPALKPAPTNSLAITLHGASVEAIGQAAAYQPKDWCWIVAPTNRRPYGFDWEDWGRMDALEVLDIAKKTLPHDPYRVYLTGHSMGGHGTWSVGTLYPDQFGVIAPSAGWISFWSYAGGWDPRDATPEETILRDSMGASDTMARIHNLKDLGVYILHGDADDNVPVEQARTMRDNLATWHKDFIYHEQPGAGHWWGNQCVDWPGIFEEFLTHERLKNPTDLAFTTPDPRVSSSYYWASIQQQQRRGEQSSFHVRKDADGTISGTTTNVSAIDFKTKAARVQLDGDTVDLQGSKSPVSLIRRNGKWQEGVVPSSQDSAERGGPFKLAFQNRMVFVFGTTGTQEENEWSAARARFDAESWYYRGNGAVDVLSDREAESADLNGRNIILYGNPASNSLWQRELGHAPVAADASGITIGDKHVSGQSLGALFCYPRSTRGSGQSMIAGFTGTDIVGLRLTDRLPVFVSGVAYPDYAVFGSDLYAKGTKGVVAAGYIKRFGKP